MIVKRTYSIGDRVVCDLCDKDYSNDSATCGGFQFQSKAVCPECAPSFMESVKKYNEESFIRATCPDNMPFRDWVINVLRNGKPGDVTITSFENGDDFVDYLNSIPEPDEK